MRSVTETKDETQVISSLPDCGSVQLKNFTLFLYFYMIMMLIMMMLSMMTLNNKYPEPASLYRHDVRWHQTCTECPSAFDCTTEKPVEF